MYDYNFSDSAFTTWVLLRQTWSAIQKVAERKLAKSGLTPEQVDVLWICRDHPGPLIPAEISRLMFREEQTVTGLLNRMEREGLVKRVPKRKGKPFTEIKITDKGTAAAGAGVEIAMALITEIMSIFSAPEHEELQRMLRLLQHKIAELLQVELVLKDYSVEETIPAPR